MMPNSDSIQLAKFLVDLLRCELVADNQLCCVNCTRCVQYCFEGFADEDNVDKTIGELNSFVVKLLPEKIDNPVTIDQVERRFVLFIK